MANQVTRITTIPGVSRDGTHLDGQYYSDAQWCRFVLGKPKKMGGYRNIAQFTAPVLSVYTFSKTTENLVHCFSTSKIEAVLTDINGNGGAVYDRTPVGFITYSLYSWTVDTAYDMTGGGKSRIYAHAARNDGVPTPIFYGTVDTTEVLTPITLLDVTKPATTGNITTGTPTLVLTSATGYVIGSLIRVTGAGVAGVDLFTDITNLVGTTATLRDNASTTVAAAVVNHILGCDGGIVTIGAYLFYYGSRGLIANTDLNNPTLAFTGDANMVNPVGSRVTKGLPVKGGGQSPAGMFWSEDSVIKVSFVGGTLLFQYDIVTSQSSLLSANTVMEYDGAYYWLGYDRALAFVGGVKELPNTLNNNWFYESLNWGYAYKVWATKVPRYGEIWWFFPKGESTKCNWALIYNIRENTWYDTPIERSAGYYVQNFRFPLWGAEDGKLWSHEFNWDKIDGESISSVESYFITHDIGFPTGGAVQEAPQGANAWTRIERVEPDFAQTGDMTVEVLSKEYANSPTISLGKLSFGADTVRVDMRHQARIMTIKFSSNDAGGSYWMGAPLLHLELGDRRE